MSEILTFIICFFIAEDLQESKQIESQDKGQKLETPKHKAWLALQEEKRKQKEIEDFRQTILDFENSWS